MPVSLASMTSNAPTCKHLRRPGPTGADYMGVAATVWLFADLVDVSIHCLVVSRVHGSFNSFSHSHSFSPMARNHSCARTTAHRVIWAGSEGMDCWSVDASGVKCWFHQGAALSTWSFCFEGTPTYGRLHADRGRPGPTGTDRSRPGPTGADRGRPGSKKWT